MVLPDFIDRKQRLALLAEVVSFLRKQTPTNAVYHKTKVDNIISDSLIEDR
jgi:hypothetical protein